jgi:CRISPR-associated protein Csb2
VELALQGLGQPEDFGDSPLLARSRAWISRTPFLPTRHPKRTRAGVAKLDESGLQIDSPEHELRRLLGLAGLPRPVLVEPVAGTMLGEREVPWHAFLRRRERGEGRPAAKGAGYGFRIEFAEAAEGPVAVGYASHFGMGGFDAIELSDNYSPRKLRISDFNEEDG